MKSTTILRNGYVFAPGANGNFARADLVIHEDKVIQVGTNLDVPSQAEEYNCDGLYILPGLVDSHVHIGYGSNLDMVTETKSAVAGGISTVLTHYRKPENYHETVPQMIAEVEAKSYCNVGIHLGLSTYAQLDCLPGYVSDFGISSFKYFMNYIGKGGEKAGVEIVNDGTLLDIMRKIAHVDGVICLHCENQEIIENATKAAKRGADEGTITWAQARPAIAETEAVLRAAYFAAKTGCAAYIAHISSVESIDIVRMMRNKYKGLKLYAETCPHYLTFACEDFSNSLGKVNPPLRSRKDVDGLWDAICEGIIDVVGSDHVARPLSAKRGTIWEANAGFPGSGTMLPVLLDEGVNKRGIPLAKVVELLAVNPAKIFKIKNRCSIFPGSIADLTVVDLTKKQAVKVEFSHADYNLYEDRELKGWPVFTFVNGVESRTALYSDVAISSVAGKYLRR